MKTRAWQVAFILALSILSCPGLAGAEQRPPLRVGSEISFPPYADIDNQGRPTGFAIELFILVAGVMNIPVAFQPDRWDTVWQRLKTGKIDALPLVARLPEREGQVEFTEPHTIGYDTFFVRKGHEPIRSIEQARSLSIIVPRADTSHDALASRGFSKQLVLVDSLAEGFRLLASGHHDAVLAPSLQGNMLLHSIGLEKIVMPGPALKEYRREFCFAVRKGDIDLRDRLNHGLAVVKANGEYDRLYRKWLDIDTSLTFPVEYVAWSAAIVASLLSILCLWNWHLRRQMTVRSGELAQAYAAVQTERQQLHDVLQELPVYLVLLGQDHKVAFANRFFEQRYGKAFGRHCYDYLFDRSEPCENCQTFKVLQTHAPLEWQWAGPDGRIYEIHDFPFTDIDGSPMVMEVGIDITEITRVKQALRETNASLEQRVIDRTAELEAARQEAERARDLLRVTMDNAPALMSYIDKKCRYRRVNRTYELWFGYTSEQVCGHHVWEILGEAAWQSLSPFVERALAGEQVEFELNVPYRKGGPYWIHATYSPDFDAEGRVRGFVAHALDISKHKQAEAALREADRRKDEFLAMLAHELRNPLAPISNAVQIMQRPNLDPTRLAWCRDVIGRQIEHLVRLVDDLLDVSRISRGRIELKKEPIKVSAIVQRAVETSQPLIDISRHEFTVCLPPEPVIVEGDLVRLSQVVSNLLNNAAKYTDEGGCIELTVEPAGNNVFIRVRDNGRGIDPVALTSLFQLFYQVDRTIDRAEGGLGIGLALVKSLMAMHGGEVWAESRGRGQGSEFVIRLPCLRELPVAPVSRQVDSRPDEGPFRILVVDDNRDAAQSLSLLLASDGHEVLQAYDGYTALETAVVERPQVILLDIGLPGMNGYEVARALRQHSVLKMTHLIALSGYGREIDRERARTAGFDAYLTKPVDFDELLCALYRPSFSGVTPN